MLYHFNSDGVIQLQKFLTNDSITGLLANHRFHVVDVRLIYFKGSFRTEL